MERIFIDTNILIYHFQKDSQKFNFTSGLFSNPQLELITSTQVLSEFANVCLKKKFVKNDNELKLYINEILIQFELVAFSVEEINEAINLKTKYKLSFYDSLVIANALTAGCTTLYSEDLHNGLKVDNKLKIVNPFKL